MDAAGGVLDGNELWSSCLLVDLGPAKSGEYQRCLATDQVRSVDLGRHVDGQCRVLQGGGGDVGVGCGLDKVAAQPDEHLGFVVAQCADGIHGVVTVVPRRVESE